MQCPKCNGVMTASGYQGVEVHRCGDCNGLWFRPGSAEKLKSLWMSEFLDTGKPSTGKQYDSVRDIKCPDCAVDMDQVKDERQTHIWYETCPNCSGCYFDAGEFTDWKYDTLMDRVRDLLKRSG